MVLAWQRHNPVRSDLFPDPTLACFMPAGQGKGEPTMSDRFCSALARLLGRPWALLSISLTLICLTTPMQGRAKVQVIRADMGGICNSDWTRWNGCAGKISGCVLRVSAYRPARFISVCQRLVWLIPRGLAFTVHAVALPDCPCRGQFLTT